MLLWEGASLIDGSPIVLLATAATSNRKTGDMVQTWILRADMEPLAASKSGSDASICGDCPHRWATGGACYVNIGQAPQAVYRAWKRGSYDEPAHLDRVSVALQTLPIRCGAYGDPAAVPADVWLEILARGMGRWTGYTHQWHEYRVWAGRYKEFLMASVDHVVEARVAQDEGWRYFQVLKPGEQPDDTGRAVECLADSVGKTCAECGLCDGAPAREKQPRSIYIHAHGALVGRMRKPAALRVVP